MWSREAATTRLAGSREGATAKNGGDGRSRKNARQGGEKQRQLTARSREAVTTNGEGAEKQRQREFGQGNGDANKSREPTLASGDARRRAECKKGEMVMVALIGFRRI